MSYFLDIVALADVVRNQQGIKKKLTLEEIGNIYGVTKECIRQTEMRAIQKMRMSALSQDLLSSYIG